MYILEMKTPAVLRSGFYLVSIKYIRIYKCRYREIFIVVCNGRVLLHADVIKENIHIICGVKFTSRGTYIYTYTI